MAFWGSLLGNTLGGAALGGLAAKATGGNWRKGALLGGVGGVANYGFGSGGTNWVGEGSSGFGNTALGGLLGGGASQAGQTSANQYNSAMAGKAGASYMDAAGNRLSPYGTIAPMENVLANSNVANAGAGSAGSGLLGTMTDYGKALKPWGEIGAGGFSAYGNIQGARTQQQMAEDEAAYRNRIADLQEREYNLASKYLQEDRAREAGRLANEEAIQAFSGSALRRNTLEDEQFLQPVETVNNNAADAFAQTSKTTNYYD